MATTIGNATLIAQIRATLTKAQDIGSGQISLNSDGVVQESITGGTAANQANRMWADERTLSHGASENLDLVGVLADAFGDTISLDRIVALLFIVDDAQTAGILIGGAGSNPVTSMFGAADDVLKLPPDSFVLLSCVSATGFAVTAGTADILKVAHGGEASDDVTYKVVILGADS